MSSPSMMDRLRYAFDNYMAKGTVALIGGLAVFSLVIILLGAVIVTLIRIAPEGGAPPDFVEAIWLGLVHALDSGAVGEDAGWNFRLVMFTVTLGGIFITSTLIGVLTSGIEAKMEELRKGRSRVIERGHTAILGWSPQIITILSELIEANANQSRSCIAIMGKKGKVEMEETIRDRIGDTGRTRIVCRNGDPIVPNDLRILNLDEAKSIVILTPESDNPDADVIKTVLAVINNPERRLGHFHIVAEFRDSRNADAARMVGKGDVEVIQTGLLVSRIIAQTCRQPGLSVVYIELLDFAGDEIYFQEEPALVGRTFGEALLAYEDSAVMGICRADGKVTLNPPMDTVLQPGDQIIAISADDDTIVLSGKTDLGIREDDIRSRLLRPPAPERTLMLGWNERAPTVIAELDRYVEPGSTLVVVANRSGIKEQVDRVCCPQNLELAFQWGDTASRQTLEGIDITKYDHIVVLPYSDTLGKQEADALTMLTLLHLRDIVEREGAALTIVTEMLDPHNQELAQITRADDFIVSDKLTALMLAQVSENKYLNAVFEDLFDPEGSEVYLKPAGDYVLLDTPLNFYTVVEAARRRGEVALGYRLHAYADNAGKDYGVVINPDKSEEILFSAEDRVILLAEE